MLMVRFSPESFMSCSEFGGHGRELDGEHQHVALADLLDQAFDFGVLAAVIARLADEQENAAVILGLRFEQVDGVADGVEDRVSAVAGLQPLEALVDVFRGLRVVVQQVRDGVEADQRRLAARIGEEGIKQRA